MKKEEQRIAIAEERGWMDIYRAGKSGKKTKEGLLNGTRLIGTKDKESANYGRDYTDIPNYPFDLNAMHEVEKTLPKEKHELYFGNLVPRMIDWMDPKERAWPKVCFATAEQRAEAFLKTIGKWKETE